MPTIGLLSNSYDVALLQEDFNYHALLRTEAKHALLAGGVQLGTRQLSKIVKMIETVSAGRAAIIANGGLSDHPGITAKFRAFHIEPR